MNFLNSTAEHAVKGDDRKAVTEFLMLFQNMAHSPAPFPAYAERIAGALNSVEDEDDLYAMSKHLWVFMGQKPNKPAAKAIAAALYRWFPMIHENLFGERRYLTGQTEESFNAALSNGGPQVPPPQSEEEEELDEELEADEYDEEEDEEGDSAQMEN